MTRLVSVIGLSNNCVLQENVKERLRARIPILLPFPRKLPALASSRSLATSSKGKLW
jgi:hypothetical protein